MSDTSAIESTTRIQAPPFLLICSPALIIAMFIICLGFIVHKGDMDLFELTSAIYDKYYFAILSAYLIVLPAFFPFVQKKFKENGISLVRIFSSKKSLCGDLILGALAGISSYIFFFLDVHVVLKMPVEKAGNIPLILLEVLSLVIIAGFFKEIYFRILDWPNFGLSFFLGLIWYLFFRKRGSLIIPVVGHGLFNLLGILARAGALSFLGIIPIEG
jgi:membrane protease YdiL (CAAX protease family)